MDSVRTVLSEYATFSGRARRSEHWWFALVSGVVTLLVDVLYATTRSTAFDLLALLVVLASVLPSLSVLVRRLHDTGRSGWWYPIALVRLVGGIVLLVFTVQDSQPGANQYGPSPKEAFGQAGYADAGPPPGWA